MGTLVLSGLDSPYNMDFDETDEDSLNVIGEGRQKDSVKDHWRRELSRFKK
jgi:hypothetical protein